MPIYGDLFKATEENDSVNQEFSSGFFQNGMNIQPEEEVAQVEEKSKSPLEEDWKTYVNRMFMKGMTADQIIEAIGEQIEKLQNAQEILKYIKKYEGLIGTIFVDSKVLEQGFPMALMPKGWNQFHRYSINCEHPVIKAIQRAEGGLSGDIDLFLSSHDENVKTEEEVCSICGLPVLHKGVFNQEVIGGILESLGREGNSLGQLQSAMKEIALKINSSPKQEIEFEKADTNFGLTNPKVNVPFEKKTVPVETKLEYRKSADQDIDVLNFNNGDLHLDLNRFNKQTDVLIQDENKNVVNEVRLYYKKTHYLLFHLKGFYKMKIGKISRNTFISGFLFLLIIIAPFILGCEDSYEKRNDLLRVEISDVYGDANAIVTVISDDAYYDTAKNLNTLFGEKGLKCTVAGAVDYIKPYYKGWIKILDDENINLVNHSYRHISMGEEGEIANNKKALKHEIVDSDKYFEKKFGEEQIVFVCPDNQMCELGYDILLKNDFWAVRRGNRGFNSLSPKEGTENGDWYNLMVQGICDENVDTSVRNSWIDEAIIKKLWLIEMWHNVMPQDDGFYQTIIISDAEEHLDYILKKSEKNEVWVATFDEAVKYIREKQNINVYAYIDNDELYIKSKLNNKKMSYETFNQPLTIHIYLTESNAADFNRFSSFANGELVMEVVPGKEYKVQLTGD